MVKIAKSFLSTFLSRLSMITRFPTRAYTPIPNYIKKIGRISHLPTLKVKINKIARQTFNPTGFNMY